MSQEPPSQQNSKAAEQLESLVDLLFNLSQEEDSNPSTSSEQGIDAATQAPVNRQTRTEQNSQREKTIQSSQSTPSKKGVDAATTLVNQPIRAEQHDRPKEVTAKNSPSKIGVTDQLPHQRLNRSSRDDSTALEESSLAHLRQLIADLEQKLNQLEVHDPSETVDSLLPLIAQLLEDETREPLLPSLVPIFDEAIRQKVKDSPQAIAKAIAPEIACAIQEQIQLDRDAVSRTLGPQMGEAIKTQIMVERDAMVDALYPVIGNTISKYMVEVVKDINEQVENTLSLAGIKRKIRAKLQGVSEAELIFQEAMQYAVLAIFLIHKASGLVIREVQPESNFQLEADMIAGMLTAIRVFVNDSVAIPGEVSELHEIEYDSSKIIIEVAGYCYLAVVVKGEPSKALINKIRETLGKIVLECGKAIEEFDGDPATVPDSVQPLLVDLVETKAKQEQAAQESNPPTLAIVLLCILAAIIVPLGIIWYRGRVANRIETNIATALDEAPELSVYRLIPEVRQGKMFLTGRVPNQYLQNKAAQIASEAAPDLELDNQIVPVDVPPDPVQAAAEVQRATALFNQREGVAISTRYQDNTVTVEGSVPSKTEIKAIVQGFEQIPGVRSVVATVQARLPPLNTKIYFGLDSAQFDQNISDKISTVRQFLSQYPNAHLKVIGHSDKSGNLQDRQSLALRRARAVEQALIEQGVERSRLHVVGSANLPPGVTEAQPSRLGRIVHFEAFTPSPNDRV